MLQFSPPQLRLQPPLPCSILFSRFVVSRKKKKIPSRYLGGLSVTTSTVKYRQSAPPSRPFVVVLWRLSAVCRSYDMNLVHIFHILQSIRTFERTQVPHKNLPSVPLQTKVLTSYKLRCTLPYDFPFPGCKIKVGRSRETGRSGGTLRYRYRSISTVVLTYPRQAA